jgi:hypothetical protein
LNISEPIKKIRFVSAWEKNEEILSHEFGQYLLHNLSQNGGVLLQIYGRVFSDFAS